MMTERRSVSSKIRNAILCFVVRTNDLSFLEICGVGYDATTDRYWVDSFHDQFWLSGDTARRLVAGKAPR